MNTKILGGIIFTGAMAGMFALGRWLKPKKGKKRSKKGEDSTVPPASGSDVAARLAALAKSDPEIARFAKANPDLIARAAKDPASVMSDPKVVAWAATHPAQVAALQEAAKGAVSASAPPSAQAPALPAGKAGDMGGHTAGTANVLYVGADGKQYLGSIYGGTFSANPAAIFKEIKASLAPGHAYSIGPLRNCGSGECEFDVVKDLGQIPMEE